MKYVLALDQGTTSSRAILFDSRGAIRAMAQKELRQIYPQPGWVEHDPEELWRSQLACARAVLRRASIDATRIAALGISNQRETTLVWNRATGRPVCNAIVWQDRRTTPMCERLKSQGLGPWVRARTGLVIDPYFSATKLAWILQHIPDARRQAQRGELAFGTVDSWLAWRLSAGRLHVTDPSNASRTLLYDIHARRWDPDLLKLFGVPASMLPRILPSSHVHGATAAALLGAAIPIAGIAGDQQAALFGQACHRRGMAKNTYGTGCFLLLNTGAKPVSPSKGLLATAAAQAGLPQFALEGSVFIGGAVVQWLRDGLRIIRTARDVERLASSVSDAGGVVFVPAFTGLGAPYWDPHARGAILGLTRGSSAAHIARAALEAIAFQSAELLHAMSRGAGLELKELRVDGGAAANDLLMQIQADLLGIPVVRPRILETTALGAAYLAGLATGVWPDRTVIARHWKAGARFEPRVGADEAKRRLAEWRRAVERSRNWARQ
ncbi:MAG: glycerol kinase [Betaproteobacteria bacterium RIFCSPLOWO2_02_FULL_65_24]|nr:MAG: glycerol kinase [Betaproteobacteria bacterium RIFCSPLOWO2_02_FULL_65_24]